MSLEFPNYCPLGHNYYYAPNFTSASFNVIYGADFSSVNVVYLSGAGISAGVSGVSGGSDNYISKNLNFSNGDVDVVVVYSVKDGGNIVPPSGFFQYGGVSFLQAGLYHTGISFSRIHATGTLPVFVIHSGLGTLLYNSDQLSASTYYDVSASFIRRNNHWFTRLQVPLASIDVVISADLPSSNVLVVSAPISSGSGSNLILRNIYITGRDSANLTCACDGVPASFVFDKRSGVSPTYIRFTDTSDFTTITDRTNYLRTWRFTNNMTSAVEYVISTSASVVKSFEGNLGDTFTVSLSASIPRMYSTSFESLLDFTGFFITTPGDYATMLSAVQEKYVSGSYSGKAWILSARDVNNESTSGYLPHRGYPTIMFEHHSGGIYDTAYGTAYKTPCLASIYVWVDIHLQKRAPLIDDWFSFATFTSDTSDAFNRVVVVSLDPDNYIYAGHVPRFGQNIHIYQATSANGGLVFPQQQWVRLDIYLDFDPINGYIKVFQDGTLVSHALVYDCSGTLAQSHFGMYASAAITSGVCYNDNLRIMEVADFEEAIDLINSPIIFDI